MATYGAESLTLNKDIAKQLAAVEKNVLRRMFGGINVNESWRKWYNKELMQLFGDFGNGWIGKVTLIQWTVKEK